MADNDDIEAAAAPKGPSSIQDRIAAFQMLDRMAEATQAQKIVRLTLVGFNRNEVASMLQTSPASVTQTLYLERKRTQKPARGSKSKPKADEAPVAEEK